MTAWHVGHGLDVHAFADGESLWLGGVQIPHTRGLVGHSDGDAVLHAVVDALLGATGRGDIGAWFPSTDERWRGAASSDLLRHVWAEVGVGWRVGNLDVTIVAAEPRLAPFREMMRARVAEILETTPERVSIKATTTDGLGALGRGEGVMAQAVVLLEGG